MARPINPLSKRSQNKTFTPKQVMAALSKQTVRASKALQSTIRPPPSTSSAYAWTLQSIMAARDQQLRGNFALPYELAKSMRTDDAIFTARRNRLAPEQAIPTELVQSPLDTTGAICIEAKTLFGDTGSALAPGTVQDILGTLADHGLAIAKVDWTLSGDGSRLTPSVAPWPLRWVRWDSTQRSLVTRLDAGSDKWEIPVTHGDGRWIVFASHHDEPWTQDAAILPGCLVWAAHAFAGRDWAKSSKAHGDAKFIGTMQDGVPIQGSADGLSAEATGLLDVLRALYDSESPYGLLPFGAKIESIASDSSAWQVFSELLLSKDKAAARIYLGTDGSLGATGGAPGVDITALFGVSTTIVQGDLWRIEHGLNTGVISRWAELNFGNPTLAPKLVYQIPDADAEAVYAAFATRNQAFFADCAAMRASGFELTPESISLLAHKHNVPVPSLAATQASTIQLAPTDIAKVVKVSEARASQGLPPFGDARDDMTIGELDAMIAASQATPTIPT